MPLQFLVCTPYYIFPLQYPQKLDPMSLTFGGQVIRHAISRRVRMIRGKISSLADRFLKEHERQGKITVRWQEDQPRDKAIAQEEKMYQNWGR